MILPRALAKILVNHMPVPQAVREADGELRALMR